jgi:hypothetical protein
MPHTLSLMRMQRPQQLLTPELPVVIATVAQHCENFNANNYVCAHIIAFLIRLLMCLRNPTNVDCGSSISRFASFFAGNLTGEMSRKRIQIGRCLHSLAVDEVDGLMLDRSQE